VIVTHSDGHGVPGAPDASGAPDSPDASAAPDAPDAPGTPDAPDAPDAPGVDRDLVDYYSRRAAEYERVYDKPERQPDLERLRRELPPRFAGRTVLEIGCGTGYWTRGLATTARHVTAVDASAEVLAIARRKPIPPDRVTFLEADAFLLPAPLSCFDAIFAGFFWSHVPRRSLPAWLEGLAGRAIPGGELVFLDNRYVEGSSTPIDLVDAAGDSWQVRVTADRSRQRVLKNFPTAGELEAALGLVGDEVRVETLPYYWLASCRTRKKKRGRETDRV
jgi:demethylmenaquinone methyltransferase/2-methoxy-6-polyprenyl-1,4-benzoquinol methylase